jgi:hypothetical protein
MKSLPKTPFEQVRIMKQRGVILFFALISLLAIMLAAVALIRSVDTSTLIAGNLAFRQAATTSGDAGTEAAVLWLANANAASAPANVLTNPAHPFNIDNGGPVGSPFYSPGYWSSLNPNLSLTATSGTRINWNDTDSVLVTPDPDSSGNSIRYVIQRMCNTANLTPVETPQVNNCLYSGPLVSVNGQAIPLPQQICQGPGCPPQGQSPQIRITSRITGPRNTVSYVQAFVY